jgi:PKD repeat protein
VGGRTRAAGSLLGSLAVPSAHGGLASDASGNVFDSEGDSGGSVLRIDTTPDPAISASPSSGLTSQTATFDGSATETVLWGIADYSWQLAGATGFTTDTGAAPTVSEQFNSPGTYPLSLQVTGTNGRVGQTAINYVVGDSHAAFTAPAQALTGTPVTFDASSSAIPDAVVSDYAWDFDGSGSYGTDGGTSPTISHTFSAPGTYTVQLRVTRSGGRIDFASGTIEVTPIPPLGRVGVSIDGGDYATDSPNAQISAVWPSGAAQLLISNDGGFAAAGSTQTLSLASTVPWTLARTGSDRLPKTVYVRFLGAGMDDVTFSDDIILDEVAPTLQSAQLVSSSTPAKASTSRAERKKKKKRSYRIRFRAQDKLAGICAVAGSARRSHGTIVTIKNCHRKGITHLARTVTLKSTAAPAYVRVRNSAGKWSRWLKARRK